MNSIATEQARFFSEEQIMTLVLAEKSGLLGMKTITRSFGISAELFAAWREKFKDWFPFHVPSVRKLEAERDRLRRWQFMRWRRLKRGGTGERKFSEEQISTLVALVRYELASADEVCRWFRVSEPKLYEWWTQLQITREDFDEIRRLQRENNRLKALLAKAGLDPGGGDYE